MGYDKPFVFITQGLSSPASSPRAARGGLPASTNSKRAGECSKRSLTTDSSFTSSSTSMIISPAVHGRTSVPRPLNLYAFQNEYVFCHLLEHFDLDFGNKFSTATDVPALINIITRGRWQFSSAYISALALAEAFFGRVHKVEEMIYRSMQLYGQALYSLQRDLQRLGSKPGKLAYVHLYTGVLLGLYELVCPASENGWRQHSSGISALVS